MLKPVTVQNTYPDIKVSKLQCDGHVQIRVGCRLHNLKQKVKNQFGRGKLTNNTINGLQNYYGISIISKKTNLKGMQSAVKPTLFHVTS